MKPHSEESYQNWKDYNDRTRDGKEPFSFELDDISIKYTTVHIPEDQRPFNFAVAASIPEGQEGYEIAVSDDVPKELRGLWAWHEYNDFKNIGFEGENRCLQSEQRAAENLAGTDLYKQYLEYRIPFYQSLASFMANDIDTKKEASEYDVADVQGCYSALKYLDSIY